MAVLISAYPSNQRMSLASHPIVTELGDADGSGRFGHATPRSLWPSALEVLLSSLVHSFSKSFNFWHCRSP